MLPDLPRGSEYQPAATATVRYVIRVTVALESEIRQVADDVRRRLLTR